MDNNNPASFLTAVLQVDASVLEQFRSIVREEIAAAHISAEQVPRFPTHPVNTKELCKFLRISEPTAIRWRQRGKIPFLSIDSTIRYYLPDVVKALETKTRDKK